MSRWCNTNQLTVNAKKTMYQVFAPRSRSRTRPSFELTFNTEMISETADYKYLGTIIDNGLTGTSQYNKVIGQVSGKIQTFARIRHLVTQKTALQLYKTTILPILDYNDVYYFLLNEDKQRKLQAMQNRALRIIFKDRHYHVNEMHELANLSTLMVRRKVHMAGLMYKRSKNSFYHDTHNLPLRQFDKVVLRTPVVRLFKTMKSPQYMGSKLWNSLPVDIQKSQTYDCFKFGCRGFVESTSP